MPKINLSKLEILQKVREHFVEQGALAWDDKAGICKYRTPNGQKCAVGALIPDELYNPSYEGKAVHTINTFARQKFGELLFDPKIEPFLTYLQDMHDRAAGAFREDPARALSHFQGDLDHFARYISMEPTDA